MSDLSQAEARRIAIAAQGFARPRPRSAGAPHLRRTIRQLGLLQIDTVNVVARPQYLVPFSRLGPYDTSLLDDLIYRRHEFTEQWAHEASILPVETWPLLRHRMETFRLRPWGFGRFIEEHPEYARWVIEQVRTRGALAAEDLPPPDGIARRIPGDAWIGTVPRAVLEAHFARGVLAIARRAAGFVRSYDLAERVVAAEHHGRRVSREEGERELLRIAARAHGIGTAADLADYFRMPVRDARRGIAELAGEGEIRAVKVEGWREQAWLHREAPPPAPSEAAALLSPFDPLVWFRPRTERLFGFEYRLEIYVPSAQRRWGYYVLPFLLRDRLAARVDVKTNRAAGRLEVQGAWREPHAETGSTAEALARELRTLAEWLGLERVVVGRRGDLARTLAAALVRLKADR